MKINQQVWGTLIIIATIFLASVYANEHIEKKVEKATTHVKEKAKKNSEKIEKVDDTNKEQDFTLREVKNALETITKDQKDKSIQQKKEYDERLEQQQTVTSILQSLKQEIDKK